MALYYENELRNGACALSSLSKKTRKSNCFGSTFFSLSYLSSLSVDSARV